MLGKVIAVVALAIAIPSISAAQQAGRATAADAQRQSDQLAALFPSTNAQTQPSSGPASAGYAPLVKEWLGSYLRDPYSAVVTEVRGPRATSFKPDVWTKITGTAVCYDINAKNAYGGYTGVKRHLFIFDAGRVAYHISTADERQNSLAPQLVRSECDLPAGA